MKQSKTAQAAPPTAPEENRKVMALNFADANIPMPEQNTLTPDTIYVRYGFNNLYPEFLLRLFNSSPAHGSITSNKAKFIMGGGLKDATGKPIKVNVNPTEDLNLVAARCTLDFEIYNFFCVEVIYNYLGQPVQWYHVPGNWVRWNKSRTKFWVCEDWPMNRKRIEFKRFETANKEQDSRIYLYEGYNPGSQVYPVVDYANALKPIATDAAIGSFNLNNIKNHFSVSTLITFFSGSNLKEEVKDQVIKEITDSYSGSDGKKIIVDFQQTSGKSAEVTNISPNEWDEAFSVTKESVKDDIYIGHQVTNPSLFGVKTEGQLGGGQEIEISYQIFLNTYGATKRTLLSYAFTSMLKGSSLEKFGEIGFIDKPLVEKELPTEVMKEILTIDELRKRLGEPPLPNGRGAYRLNETPAPAEEPAIPPAQTAIPEVSQEVPGKSNRRLIQPSEEDFDKVQHLGFLKADFHIMRSSSMKFASEGEIAQYIINNQKNKISIADAAKELGIPESELLDAVRNLADSGMIDATINTKDIEVKPDRSSVPGSISVVYDYVKRPEASGNTIIPTSRGFCRKLIENDRYYTRQDIQQMSAIFGYDVFVHTGGFWHNADTGETETHCRHMWKMLTVKRK